MVFAHVSSLLYTLYEVTDAVDDAVHSRSIDVSAGVPAAAASAVGSAGAVSCRHHSLAASWV